MFVDTECSSDDILAELDYEKCYEDSLSQEIQESDEESSKEEEESSDPSTNADESEESDF
jgi:hypothetical protein